MQQTQSKKSVLSAMSLLMIWNLMACSGGGSTDSSSVEACSDTAVSAKLQAAKTTAHTKSLAHKQRPKVDLDWRYHNSESAVLAAPSKPGDPMLLKGAQLMLIVDPQCDGTLPASVMPLTSSFVLAHQHLDPQFKKRAFHWELPVSLAQSELEALASRDECLIRMNSDIRMQTAATFNDPLSGNQRHLDAIRFRKAYDIFYGADGITQNVVIAVIDNGVNIDHQDLSGVLWTNANETASNSTDDDSNGVIDDVNGATFYGSGLESGDPRPLITGDESYHGTHVAGIVAAEVNNTLGTVGIAGSSVELMSVNVFGSSTSALTSNVVNGINYAVTMGADVINLSLGGSGFVSAYEDAIQDAVDAGVFVVAAAGNNGAELDPDGLPIAPAIYAADISGFVSVGATIASNSNLASFSNFSSTYVEFAAPGMDTSSSGIYSLTDSSNSSYGLSSGTSMAAPIVSGAAALAIALMRSRGYSSQARPSRIETLLRGTGTVNSDLVGEVAGCSVLNMENLAQEVDSEYP